MWPSIGPSSVWGMELTEWCLFAAAADQEARQRRQSSRKR